MSNLVAIQKQILEVDEMLARLQGASREKPRLSVLTQIRALEKEHKKLITEFDAAAQREEQDVCRYAIDYPDRPTVAGVAAALGGFQALFSDLYILFKKGTSKKGPKNKTEIRLEDVPQFGWGYEFDGSLGIAMTLPTREGLWNDPVADAASRAILEIANAKENKELVGLVGEFGPEAITAMHRWADIHAQKGYGVDIEWQKFSGETYPVKLRPAELSSLRDRLSKLTIESRLEINGALVAVDLDDSTCRIRTDDGRDITSTFDTAINEEHAAKLPARYQATFRESTPIVGTEGVEPESSYFLLGLTALGSDK